MIDANDLYHDLEVSFHRCYICNTRIETYYYQQFTSGLQVVCDFCYNQKKDYDTTTKLLEIK